MSYEHRLFVPHGHFYSPLVNPREAERRSAQIWPQHPRAAGIDFNDPNHQALLGTDFPTYLKDWDYPQHAPAVGNTAPENAGPAKTTTENTRANNEPRFYINNPFFSLLDARALYVLMRKLRPRHLIEVGSGFSTLLALDVNRRYLDNRCAITAIDPEPRQDLSQAAAGDLNTRFELNTQPVQDLPENVFDHLSAGDILFIDSSHVAKTGSDVNFLFFHIFPRLQPGVFVHIHDIFLPLDYPRNWVLKEGRSWNEQYVLQAFLMYNHCFEVYFGSNYAVYRFPQLVAQALRLPREQIFAGGSLWLRRTR